MGRFSTADEVQAEHIHKMGGDLGRFYHALWNEVAWLHVKWAEYVELFGTKPARIDLINGAAPVFFRIVQDILWKTTLLHIARLTDPVESMGKKNLTIRALPYLVDANLQVAVAALVDDAVKKAAFCRDWRNRHIAHSDLALAIKQGAIPLAGASRKGVKEVLAALAEVMQAVSRHYFDADIFYDDEGNVRGGVIPLLYVLDDGLNAAAERDTRMQSGKFRPEDIAARDL